MRDPILQIEEALTVLKTLTKDIDYTDRGYKEVVLECHKVLDELDIPSAKGVTCQEEGCESQLGHRLRTLRDMYLDLRKRVEANGGPPVTH